MSEAADMLVWQLRAVQADRNDRVGALVLEHRFDAGGRRWRFDLAWPAVLVACEVDGGSWIGGRHTSGSGFEADCVKLSTAAAQGWRVLRVTPRMIEDGLALSLVLAALGWRQ